MKYVVYPKFRIVQRNQYSKKKKLALPSLQIGGN